MNTNLEIGFNKKRGVLTFTQRYETDIRQEYPAWPWPDLVKAFGLFDDVISTVHNEVKQFMDAREFPCTIILEFRRGEKLPPNGSYCRCANAWLKFTRDLSGETLTMELRLIPGTYKDFVLLDVLDSLEDRAGRGKNRYVDGRPGVLRQKLDRALQYGPHILEDSEVNPPKIPDNERVRTSSSN